jgi:ATP-dependent RNA helicase RhlE
MQFAELNLNPTLLKAVADEGYTTPTAIQQKGIPHVLTGKDLIGLAQTGTGKTAAFALPILHRLMEKPSTGPRHIRVLVLAPTRELASQIEQSFATYGKGSGLRQTVIFGGVGQGKQTDALRAGVDILVATPGRLLDLQQQGFIHLKQLEVFVLDEADRMLDMGFIHDVKRIVQLIPAHRQTLFFSATMPAEVTKLAHTLLKNPARVEVHPVSSTAERIEQSVYLVDRAKKRALLHHLLKGPDLGRTLVFTRTKQGANRVAEFLNKGLIRSEAIHGNKSQGARERALSNFVAGTTPVLVATDIAARGIDVEGISRIINFDLPNIPETYVHRIGRTARAGASGSAISFCDAEEREYLHDIERLIGLSIPRAETPHLQVMAEPPREARPSPVRPSGPPLPGTPREARHRQRDGERSKQAQLGQEHRVKVEGAPAAHAPRPAHALRPQGQPNQSRPQGQPRPPGQPGQARPQGQGRPQGQPGARPAGGAPGGGRPPRRGGQRPPRSR